MEAEKNHAFSDRLAMLMGERRWRASQVAEAAGTGKGLVSDLIGHPGRMPQRSTLAKLAAAFDVSPEFLAGTSDDRDPANPDLVRGMPQVEAQSETAQIVTAIADAVCATPVELQVWQVSAAAAGMGVAAGSTVILAPWDHTLRDALVVARVPGGGAAIRWFHHPFLIRVAADGTRRADPAGGAVNILGRVVFTFTIP